MSWTSARFQLDTKMLALNVGTAAISWQNEALPNQSTLYYTVHFMPATVEPELHGQDHERGIYQVSVFVPINDGIGTAIEKAQAVVDHFKRQNLSGVSCGVPTLTPPIQEPDWWHVPVSIPFIVL